MKLISTRAGPLRINRGSTSSHLEQRLEDLEGKILENRDSYLIRSTVRFGSRDLNLNLLAETKAFEALSSSNQADELDNRPVQTFELSPQQFDSLQLEQTTSLSAYDAIELGSKGEWKIIFSPGVRAVFAYSSTTRNSFFFGLSDTSERSRGEVFRHLAHWVAIEDGNFLIHGASLTRGSQAVLVTGPAGAGKSSLILQALEGGYQFQGDNVLEIKRSGEERFHSLGIYRTLKKRVSSPMGEPPHSSSSFDEAINKEIFYVENQRFDSRARKVAKVLYLDPEMTNSQPMSSRELFFLLGPNSVGQFPLYEGLLLSRIRDFASQVQAVRSPRLSNLQVGNILEGYLVG